MSEDKVEFKMLESKLIGSGTVVFTLEDGAKVKIQVNIARAGVAVNLKNPDGTPHYNINTALGIKIIPPNKKYSIPRDKIQLPTARKDRNISPI